VHPTPLAHGQQRLHKERSEIFAARRAKREQDHEAFPAQRSQQSGQRKVELDWVKKKLVFPPAAKREVMAPAHPQLRIARQCAWSGLPRSTYSSQAPGARAANLLLMRWLEKP
jgi:hypothetical protein